jgi:hypothetical protein
VCITHPALSCCPECGGTARTYVWLAVPWGRRIAHAWELYSAQVILGQVPPPWALAEIWAYRALAAVLAAAEWVHLLDGHPLRTVFDGLMVFTLWWCSSQTKSQWQRRSRYVQPGASR